MPSKKPAQPPQPAIGAAIGVFAPAATGTANGPTFAQLPLASIVASATNPRKTFDEAKLAELAASIAASGVHQPVLVRPLPAARLADTAALRPRPEYELVAGERRLRASRLASVATIPAMVRELSDQQVLEIQLVENLQRDDLHAMEEAEGYERLCATTGIKKEDIAAKIGKSRSYVYQRIKLIELCQEGRAAFTAGEIDASKALLIARIPNHKLQIKAVKFATEPVHYSGALPSVRQLTDWCNTNVFLHLDRARFPIESVTLVPGAGSCKACPKRTGAEPDIFADVGSADLCTDPACYHDKQHTHDEAQIAQAQARGQRVISGQEAKQLQHYEHGWITDHYRVDERHPELDSEQTIAQLLGDDCPEIAIFKSPYTGEPIRIADQDAVDAALEAKGLLGGDDDDDTGAQGRNHPSREDEKPIPVEERHQYRKQVADRTTDAVHKGLKALGRKATVTPELLRAHLLFELEWQGIGESLTFIVAGGDEGQADDDAIAAAIRALPDNAVAATWLRYLANTFPLGDVKDALGEAAPRNGMIQLADMAGVDVRKIAATVKREMEGEDRAKALERDKAAAARAEAVKAAKATTATKGSTKAGAPAKPTTAPAPAPASPTPAPAAQPPVNTAPWPFTVPEPQPAAVPVTIKPKAWAAGDAVRIKPDVKNASGKIIDVAGHSGTVVGVIRGNRLQIEVPGGFDVATLRTVDVEAA